MAVNPYAGYTPPEAPTALWQPLSSAPRELLTMPVPEWATARTSTNPFILQPNRLTDGSAAVGPSFVGGSEAQDSSYYTNNDPYGGSYQGANSQLLPSYALMEQFGKKVDGNGGLDVGLGAPGTLQRVVNIDTGETLYEGTDIQSIVDALDRVSEGGNQAQWKIETYSPGTTDPATGKAVIKPGWQTGFENVKEQSALGMLADYALPVIMSAVIPGSGLLHGALTAAGGSALSGIAQGKPLGDIAKSALISGVGGGIGGALGGAGSATGGATSGVGGAASGVGGAAGAGIGGVVDDAIINVLANTLGSGAGLGSLAGNVLSSAAGSGGGYQQQPGDLPMVTATGVRPISSGAPGLASGIGGAGALAVQNILAQQAAQQQPGETTSPEYVVPIGSEGLTSLPASALIGGGLGIAGLGSSLLGPGLTAPVAPSTPSTSTDGIAETFEPEYVVPINTPPVTPFVPPIITPTAALTTPRPIIGDLAIPTTALGGLTAAQALNQPGTPNTPREPLTVSDYINMARGGLGVIGGLFGGGGDQGGLPAGFNANTGTVTYTPLNRTQNVTPFDPFTYGQATGERSFFNPYELEYKTNVPSAQTTRTPTFKEGGEAEFDDSIEGHLAAYYSDGGHAGPGPVKGIGSGQEDKIPAWLSDGEYVWSAQDVSDLGDGSSDEGIRRLDKMRQMVRKGAGRKDTKSIARPQKGIEVMIKEVGGAA